MKNLMIFIHIIYIFPFVCGSVSGVGENTLLIGGEASWKFAEYKNGIIEAASVRSNPVLKLSSSASDSGYSAASGVTGNFISLTESSLDLSVSFDEKTAFLFRDSIDRYRVSAHQEINAADRRFARCGSGAALFDGNSPIIIEPQRGNAVFAPGSRIGDFTLEFWMYPQLFENGEQIISWTAIRQVNGNYVTQRIICSASKNRLNWTFHNFFASADGLSHINIEFSGGSPVVPKTWSHHLVRFDAMTGLIEYLADGYSEVIAYATPSGREGGNVYQPIAGNGGAFILGGKYIGLMDEFKIHSAFIERATIQKYSSSGGRMETAAIDLGENNSRLIRINVTGGRTGLYNEFHDSGRLRFSDDSEIQFFIRSGENPFRMNERTWTSFIPGSDITGVYGRYVQIAADFYPSADGETSPYLDEIRIVYMPGNPPLPPVNLTAVAVDGGVRLSWRSSPDINTTGYLIYYSNVRGELFGAGASLGSSPVNAGKTNSILIDGLKNGTLYYFRVVSYDEYNTGEFSREVTARPLAGN
ncbi:MAG: fibronectin type III domain-containing protein [Treponema sp.]|nr:fibronectin type III domain-containing protein [Treponema sp.]